MEDRRGRRRSRRGRMRSMIRSKRSKRSRRPVLGATPTKRDGPRQVGLAVRPDHFEVTSVTKAHV